MTDKNEKLNPAELADEELDAVSGGNDTDRPMSQIRLYQTTRDPSDQGSSPTA